MFDEECEYDVIADELNKKYWEEKEKKDKKIDDIMYSIWDKYRVNNSWDFLYDSDKSSSDEEVV